jgi:glycosyltransferase involved in cell wall biosynthesis
MPPVPRGLSCPLVVTLHDLIPLTYYEKEDHRLPWRMRAFYRWNLRAATKAARLVTVSETSKSEIGQVFGRAADRVSVVYNGVEAAAGAADDPSALARYNLDRPYVLVVGSWEPRKNLARLLKAYDVAVREGLPCDLVLVVERKSGHSAPLRAAVEALSSRERIHFLHSVDPAAMRAIYCRASLLAFPSLHEGFGFPPVQAMACGTPVVASRIPVMEEILGDAAYLVDPYDVRSMADGLLAVGSDPQLAGRLVKAGLNRASGYTWEEAARATLSVYNVAVNGRGGAPRGR